MDKKLFYNVLKLLFLASVAMGGWACSSSPRVNLADQGDRILPTLQQTVVAQEAAALLENGEYKKVPFNDSLSSIVYQNIIDLMDKQKIYLAQEDIVAFEPYRKTILSDFKKGDLSAAFHMFNVFEKRRVERIFFAASQVDAIVHVSEDKKFVADRSELDWFKTPSEAEVHWKQRVNFLLLKEKSSSADSVSEEQLKKALSDRFTDAIAKAKDRNANDAFLLVMNAFTTAIDPHAAYLSPTMARNFQEHSSLDSNREASSATRTVKVVRDDRGQVHQIGIITLPSFYIDMKAKSGMDPNFRSASRDVGRLLDSLKKDQVDAIILDLRNNGGGDLAEGIKVAGLFIGQAPVVQIRNMLNQIKVLEDEVAKLTWDGPLGILINRSTVSSAEIVAAAMQDYGRGIVLGTTSYGKGTVQTPKDIFRSISPANRRLLKEETKNDSTMTTSAGPLQLGILTLTTSKFYRINGGSTQLKGVTPDIEFPMAATSEEALWERSKPGALPWDQIETTYYPYADLSPLIAQLKTKHGARMEDPLPIDASNAELNEALRVMTDMLNTKVVDLNPLIVSLKENSNKYKLKGKYKAEMIEQDAPAFTLTNMEGETVRLSDYRGKIVILDFWATWCGPCVMSFPGMQATVTKYQDDPEVAFLFINTRQNEKNYKELVTDFIQKHDYTFHVLYDSDDAICAAYEIEGIPTKIFIDQQGKIRFKSIGGNDDVSAVVREMDARIELIKEASNK